MKKIIECKLVIECINEEGNNKSVIEGRGYYKETDGIKVIYFNNDSDKYKYEYANDGVTIYFNDSCYNFILNKKGEGKIKNGEFILKLTTLASKIEFNNNCICVDYSLYQNDIELGKYKTSLFF